MQYDSMRLIFTIFTFAQLCANMLKILDVLNRLSKRKVDRAKERMNSKIKSLS